MTRFIALSALLVLAACAKPDMHFQTQMVKVETPGAQNAKCYLHNQDYKYVAYTGQTIQITKSPNDMNVTCQAEGNRVVKQFIPIEKYNIGYNAHTLPKVISVDFRGVEPKPYGLPDYHEIAAGDYPFPVENVYMGPTVTATDVEPFPTQGTLEKRVRGNSNPFSDGYTSTKDGYDPTEEDK